MKRTLAAAVLGLATSLPSGAALAQNPNDWQFTAILYGWFPTIGGNTTFPGNSGGSSVSVDADTILKNLKFVFMGTLEARKGPWGAFTDVVYMDIGNDKSISRSFSIGGVPLPDGVEAHASYDLKGWAWTAAGTYRAISTPEATLDVLAGARWLDMEQTLGWDLSGNVGPIPIQDRSGNSEATLSNLDGIIGVKGQVSLGADRKWFTGYYLDVGTGDSDLTWQAMASLGYRFSWGDVVLAWRYLDYDMKSNRKIEDMNFNGPAIAAVWRW